MNEDRGGYSRLPLILVVLFAALGISVPRLARDSALPASTVSHLREAVQPTDAAGPKVDACTLLAEHLALNGADFTSPALNCTAPDARQRVLYEQLFVKFGEDTLPREHVRFLIATIPDPVESHLDMDVDSQLGVLQRAALKHGFLLDRYYLPWQQALAAGVSSSRDFYTARPGVLLFRKEHSDKVHSEIHDDLLIVFVVGEVATSGVHKQAFIDALDFVVAWRSGGDGIVCPEINVLAPYSSGSAASVRQAIERWRETNLSGVRRYWDNARCDKLTINILSGSATAHKISTRLNFILPPADQSPEVHCSFHATVAPDRETLTALVDHLLDRGLKPRQIALLAEADTTYGSGVAEVVRRREFARDMLVVRFPMEIGRLRSEYEKQRLLDPRIAPSAAAPPRTSLEIPMNDTPHARDVLPSFSEATVTVTEQRIAHSLAAFDARDIRAVIIAASDPKDVIFLARQVRRHCQDALFCTLEHHVLYTHPDVAKEFSGMVVATTYPLNTIFQDFDQPHDSRRIVPFSSSSSEGTYNAALVLMKDHYEQPEPSETKPKSPSISPENSLVDYRVPFAEDSRRPPVWLMTVSSGGSWPIACLDDLAMYPPGETREKDTYVYHLPGGIPAGRTIPVPLVSAIPVTVVTVASLLLAIMLFVRRNALYPAPAGAGPRGPLGWLTTGYAETLQRFINLGDWFDATPRGRLRTQKRRRGRRGFLLFLLFGVLLIQLPLAITISRIAYALFGDSPTQIALAGSVVTGSVAALSFYLLGLLAPAKWEGAAKAVFVLVALLNVLIALGAWHYPWHAYFDGSDRLRAAIEGMRNGGLTSGVSVFMTASLLGAGVVLWSLIQLRRSYLRRVYPLLSPFSQAETSQGVPRLRFSHLHGRIREIKEAIFGIPLPRRATKFLTTAVCLLGIAYLVLWRWTPTMEGPVVDWLLRVGFIVYVFLMVVMYLRAKNLADAIERFLRRIGEGPLAEAFGYVHPRLKAKTSAHVLATAPIPGDLEIPVRCYERLLETRAPQLPAVPMSSRPPQDIPPPALSPLSRNLVVDGVDDPLAAKKLNAELNARAISVVRQLQSGELWKFPAVDAGKEPVELDARSQAAVFLATHLTLLMRQAFAHLRNLFTGLVLMAMLFALAMNSYPFQPRRLLSAFALFLVLAIAVLSVRLLYVFNRNEVLSRIANTTPNQFSFDRSLWAPVLTYAVIPVLASIAFQFPYAGGFLYSIIGGIQLLGPH